MIKAIATILLFSIISSCGARKVDKTRNEEFLKTDKIDNSAKEAKEELNVKETLLVKVDDKNEITTKESIYEPVDPTKPASVIDSDGKKHELNNAKLHLKDTSQKNNINSSNSSNSEKFHKLKTKEKKDFTEKADNKKAIEYTKVERDAWSVWNFLWLLIPICLLVIYKKYKTKI